MASLYTPTLTYDPVTDPRGTKATHYQLERSPGDGFIYEAMADPLTGTATPFYHSDSLIIATAGKRTHHLRGHVVDTCLQRRRLREGGRNAWRPWQISFLPVDGVKRRY